MTGRDWRQMRRADFDDSAPPALFDKTTGRAGARVPATPDAYGTAALFGDEIPARQTAARRAAQREQPQADGLF